jgi:hypothetical protein
MLKGHVCFFRSHPMTEKNLDKGKQGRLRNYAKISPPYSIK